MNSTVQWVVSHRSHSLHVFWMVFETVHELLDFQISFTYIVYGSKQWKPGIKQNPVRVFQEVPVLCLYHKSASCKDHRMMKNTTNIHQNLMFYICEGASF